MSANAVNLSERLDSFRECRRQAERLHLFHAGDEWLSGGYRHYDLFDGVIRNFRTRLAVHEAILTIPFGCSNGTLRGGPIKPAGPRWHLRSFAGEVKASRREMIAAFGTMEPGFMTGSSSISVDDGRKMDKAAFDAVLRDSTFAPCPMGHVIMETWRLHESLEAGCIPLIERRPSLDDYAAVSGPHPIPTCASWRAARAYADDLRGDGQRLQAKQNEVQGWWADRKRGLRNELAGFLSGPSRRAELQRFAARPAHRARPSRAVSG